MREEKVLFHATVCFLCEDDKILLGIKAQKIGKGCWNGYGGEIEEGETVEEATVRELEEETGGVIAKVEDLEKIAIVHFHNTKNDGKTFICKVHFYIVRKWTGEIQETDEMLKPTWFSINDLPLEKMMPADRHWLPIALSGKKIIAKASLGPYQQELLSEVEIEYIESL